MVKEFAGINLASKNPKEMKHFYHDILGVPILNDNENYDGIEYGFISNAPHIWIWDENIWGSCSEGKVNLIFKAENLYLLYQHLIDNGVKCQPPYQTPLGGTELRAFDPDENVIVII